MTERADQERQVLLQVLLWNLGLFVGMGVVGWMADSSALLANAVDNGSDAVVYLLGYLAVSRRPAWKRRAATLAGLMLLVFAATVIADVVRRWLEDAEPLGVAMLAVAFLAAGINLWCLRLLRRLRVDDVNIKAAETFSLNDSISNASVIVAGVLVLWLDAAWPDLVAGALIAIMAVKGGLEILRSVRDDRDIHQEPPSAA